MQPTNWPPEHSEALREYLARGMSYSLIAEAINAKFATAYSRNAAIGRAKRMGLSGPGPGDRDPSTLAKPRPPRLHKARERHAPRSPRRMPVFEAVETARLRCVEIVPRHLSLLELEARDCRYPYGGDREGEAITFCGHPRLTGTSYCTAHFHLTRTIVPERSVSSAPLRVVEAA